MDVERVSAGEDARDRRLVVLVDLGAAGHAVELYPGGFRELVLRDQTDRQEERVAIDVFLGAGDRAAVLVDLAYRHALDALFSADLRDRVREV